MTPIEQLLAIEDIKKLKARYLRGLDTKDWDVFEAVWTEDAVFDIREAMGPGRHDENAVITGKSNIVARVRQGTSGVVTVHQGHTPEIELLSPTTAHGIWPIQDISRAEPSLTAKRFNAIHGFGYYHDDYVLTEKGWRIARTSVTRLRVDIE